MGLLFDGLLEGDRNLGGVGPWGHILGGGVCPQPFPPSLTPGLHEEASLLVMAWKHQSYTSMD
jgi:hypothetical protein